MEEEARLRKERLKALKEKKFQISEIEKEQKRIEQQTLNENIDQENEDQKEYSQITNYRINTVEKRAEQISKVLEEKYNDLQNTAIDITQLQPRKVDWDLKRYLEPKLLKLEKQTKAAVRELIRERLGNQNDLFERVEQLANNDQEE